jgi:phosphoribosylformylglycinamidine synthase
MSNTPQPHVLFLKGGATAASALSEFRLRKLLRQLAPLGVAEVTAEYRYFIELDTDSALAPEQLTFLFELLRAEEHQPEHPAVLVTPRLGTVSPWSSKATDIAANCGLAMIRRIEHGMAWRLRGRKGRPLDADALQAALPYLHDRMTESVLLDERIAVQLFHHIAPPPMATVDLLKGGRKALEQANAEWGLALVA